MKSPITLLSLAICLCFAQPAYAGGGIIIESIKSYAQAHGYDVTAPRKTNDRIAKRALTPESTLDRWLQELLASLGILASLPSQGR